MTRMRGMNMKFARVRGGGRAEASIAMDMTMQKRFSAESMYV